MTLTTERQQFEEWFHEEIVLHISTSNEAVVRLMWKAWQASRELLANREAQPVALVDRRPAASGSICWQNGGKDLAHGTELFTAPPAPAVPEWEAQPVVWEMRYWNSGHNMWHDWERITAEQHAEMSVEHATDNDYEFRVLYDAPLAPAVPEAIITAPIEAMRCGPAASYVLGWNSCRAAMLAAAPEGGNGA
ncbi:TPA: hypothetical protein MD710_004551 [Serratia marcescens]|nr:hypothetical protein [Serratia marcescens]HBV8348785.1 hypothetical protein [Serratia marcescens]